MRVLNIIFYNESMTDNEISRRLQNKFDLKIDLEKFIKIRPFSEILNDKNNIITIN